MSAFERLGAILERAERADPAASALAREVASALIDLHAEALSRILAHLHEKEPRIVEDLARDEVVASVLLIHDLHPEPLHDRVSRALEEARNALAPAKASIGTWHLQGRHLEVTLSGAGASHPGARTLVEEALLAAAPDLEGTVLTSESALVPVARLLAGRASAGGS